MKTSVEHTEVQVVFEGVRSKSSDARILTSEAAERRTAALNSRGTKGAPRKGVSTSVNVRVFEHINN